MRGVLKVYVSPIKQKGNYREALMHQQSAERGTINTTETPRRRAGGEKI
jgi:hypothetical protein